MANCECHNQRETDSWDLRILSPACGRSLAEQGLGGSQASGKTHQEWMDRCPKVFPYGFTRDFHSYVMLIYVDFCWFTYFPEGMCQEMGNTLPGSSLFLRIWGETLFKMSYCFITLYIYVWFYMYQMEVNANDYNTSHANGVWKSVILDFCGEISSDTPWRIHGAGIYIYIC